MYTYLIFDGTLYKIGKSKDPEKRLKAILTGNPSARLICYGTGILEKDCQTFFYTKRVKGEWFNLDDKDVAKCQDLINNGVHDNPEKPRWDGTGDRGKLNLCKNFEAAEKTYRAYTLDFGKYRGRKLITLRSTEELQYVSWVINTYHEPNVSKNQRKNSFRYKAFKWWQNNYHRFEHLEPPENKSNNECQELILQAEDWIYSNFIIPFGKYKGTAVICMTSSEQREYMRWYLKEGKKVPTICYEKLNLGVPLDTICCNGDKKNRDGCFVLKAFDWQLKHLWKEGMV